MRGGGYVALTAQGVDQHVVTRVRHVAAALPDAVAVHDGALRLTYAELVERAAALSSRIAAAVPPGQPVAVLHGHDAAAAVAVLAVLGAGSPVVVLDPTTPVARLHHYVEQSGATTCVTDAARAADAAQLCQRVVRTDRAHVGLVTPADEATPSRGSSWPLDEDGLSSCAPAAIVYTSGSTGRPKGVVADSASFLHDATTNGRGCYGPGAVIANLLPMAFSAGVGLLVGGLVTGSTQALFDPRTRPVAELPPWLLEHGVTVLAASPAILRGAVATLEAGEQLGDLRAVTTAGETIHSAEMVKLRAALGPRCSVHNRYGSSETWLIAEHVLAPGAPDPSGAVPVGRPVDGVTVHVLDEEGRRSTTGTGRLVVTSRWLTQGYWNAPEATAAVFTHHPDGSTSYLTSDAGSIADDGTVRLLGRVDHSVKVRGHLVEPGEVDAALHALPQVREAVVVGVVAETGRARLVAYVVPEGGALQVPELRRSVRAVLPSFMVPEQVVVLDALPRTERGKLDRSALPLPTELVVGAVPPRTDFERVVAAFVARVLDLDAVGAHDDFFEMGGDSLAAEALLAAMAADLEVPDSVLTTQLVVENPTVAELAAALRRRRRSGADAAVVSFNAGGSRTPLFVVAGAGGVALAFRRLAERLGRDQPVVALQARGLEGGGRAEWSVRSRARHHLEQVRRVQPQGPYRLAGHSLGALVALEMAHQLRAGGQVVDSLLLLDSFAPDPATAPAVLEGSLATKAKMLASLALTGVVQSRGLGHYDRFHIQGKLLQRLYRSAPWAGRAVVVVARDDPDAEARSQWAPFLTGRWDLHRISGDHTGILQEPHVGALAALVAQELDVLDGRNRDASRTSAAGAA